MSNTASAPEAKSRFVMVEGIRTHYLELGEGPPLILLHDGAFGGCAEVTWFLNIVPLSQKYRVIAPDMLGFGHTDKLHDFGGGRARRLRHLWRFLETLDISGAAFCGASMGAALLLKALADGEGTPVNAAVCISGGGFVPLNDARKQLLEFDCTIANMRSILSVMIHDEKWLDDQRVLDARFRSAIQPGAWEVTAAARFVSPLKAGRPEGFGGEDTTPYEQIKVPVLVMAGENDKLKLPGYAQELAARIPQGEVLMFPECAHFPNIEHADRFNEAVLEFLGRVYPSP